MVKKRIIIGPGTKIARVGGRPSRVVTILLAQQIGFFLLWAFADGPRWIGRYLAASAAQVFGAHQLWQPITALWFHFSAQSLLINMLSLWIFGSALERWWGPRRFLLFWIVTGVIGLAIGTAVGTLQPEVTMAGSSGSAMAMMVAFGFIFPTHWVFFYGVLPLKAKHLTLLLIAFVIVGSVVGGSYLNMAVELGGAAAAFLFLFRPRRTATQERSEAQRRRFHVIEGGRKDTKRYLN